MRGTVSLVVAAVLAIAVVATAASSPTAAEIVEPPHR
jgi:hypothetical protein